MNENVVLSGTEQDLFEHYRHHERLQEGRGDRLNEDFLAALDDLALQPFIGSRHLGNIRKWRLPAWELGIYYIVEGSRNMIVALQHLRQSPRKTRAVLKSRQPR